MPESEKSRGSDDEENKGRDPRPGAEALSLVGRTRVALRRSPVFEASTVPWMNSDTPQGPGEARAGGGGGAAVPPVVDDDINFASLEAIVVVVAAVAVARSAESRTAAQ